MPIPPQVKVEFGHPAKPVLHLEKVADLWTTVDMARAMTVDVTATVHLVGGTGDKGCGAGVFGRGEYMEIRGDAVDGEGEEDGEARKTGESREFHC
jgi:hypothetical protein